MNKIEYFYIRTLNHIHMVYKNILKILETEIIDNYNLDKVKILKNAINHDKTKFKEPQFSKYVEITWYYYQQQKGNNNYPLNKVFSSSATILHIVSEPHHPEYWDEEFLIIPDKLNLDNRDGIPKIPVNAYNMPLENIVEMVCDWAAVSEERNSSLEEWANNNVNKRWKFKKEQVYLIYDIVYIFKTQNSNIEQSECDKIINNYNPDEISKRLLEKIYNLSNNINLSYVKDINEIVKEDSLEDIENSDYYKNMLVK